MIKFKHQNNSDIKSIVDEVGKMIQKDEGLVKIERKIRKAQQRPPPQGALTFYFSYLCDIKRVFYIQWPVRQGRFFSTAGVKKTPLDVFVCKHTGFILPPLSFICPRAIKSSLLHAS